MRRDGNMVDKKIEKELPLHILNLGAGVQSSTMAFMAAHGEISPMPDAAIFADTGDEPAEVYRWLGYLMEKLPFPVIRKDNGKSLSFHIFESIKNGTRSSNPPLFTAGIFGKEGILNRSCTRDFKISVIHREVRRIMKEHERKKVIQWIGISLDESIRMKPSMVNYSTHRWPLIELRMTRADCLSWMNRNGYPEPPRSACVYCPHHSNMEWRRLRDHHREAWTRAVEFDRKIRTGIHGVTRECYVHRSCRPLDQVDLSTDSERGQGLLWGDECEGMCGN